MPALSPVAQGVTECVLLLHGGILSPRSLASITCEVIDGVRRRRFTRLIQRRQTWIDAVHSLSGQPRRLCWALRTAALKAPGGDRAVRHAGRHADDVLRHEPAHRRRRQPRRAGGRRRALSAAGPRLAAGGRTWRAYLSTQARPGQPAVNARDRIGTGPGTTSRAR